MPPPVFLFHGSSGGHRIVYPLHPFSGFDLSANLGPLDHVNERRCFPGQATGSSPEESLDPADELEAFSLALASSLTVASELKSS